MVNADETRGMSLKETLDAAGYAVEWFESGRSAIQQFRKLPFDLCVISGLLPDIGSRDIVAGIRRESHIVPIILLEQIAQERQRLEAYQTGADFIADSSISFQELLMRLKVFSKRSKVPGISGHTYFTLGETIFDVTGSRFLHKDGAIIHRCTPRERDVLRILCDSPNRAIRREDILYYVWGKYDYFRGRSMDVVMAKIRKSLAHEKAVCIETITGFGFRLSLPNIDEGTRASARTLVADCNFY